MERQHKVLENVTENMISMEEALSRSQVGEGRARVELEGSRAGTTYRGDVRSTVDPSIVNDNL